MSKSSTFRLGTLSGIMLCALALSACKGETSAEAAGGEGPLVSTITVEQAEPVQHIILAGQIRARHETALGFRVAGKIKTRNVDAGQQVKAGELLFTLDDADYMLKVSAMKAQEAVAQSRLDNAADELERHRRMLTNELVSQAQFDRVQSAYNQAKAALDAAISGRENADNDAGYTHLLAGRPAIVTDLLADVGQVVAAGQPVLTIAGLDEMEAEIYIPENYVSAVKVGDEVSVDSGISSSKTSQGRIREIAGMADSRTRTYRARISITETPPELRLGMSVNATIGVPLPAEGVLLPPQAICDGVNDRAHVWVLGEGNTATMREITVLGVQDGQFIAKGVKAGEHVIVEGSRFLTASQKVRVSGNVAE